MYLEDSKKNSCSGCTACKNICLVNAISMVEDEEGFLYPQINYNKCINCKACERICPNVKKSSNNEIIEAYGVKHKNLEERKTSRSGGVFIALSNYFLKNNGVIYGAVLNDDFSVSHKRAETKEERDKFKGSKYVQSNMGTILKQVKKDLEEGRLVLFSGTACQVAAVNEFIPKNLTDKLYTCDLICHGVPSTKVYRDFLSFIEESNNKKIEKFIFRDKSFGWEPHYETFIFEDGTKLSTQYFRNLFYGHNILRPACYECNYANTHRPGDITIADFWGIEEVDLSFKDDVGVSLTIINSTKGRKLFNSVKDELDTIDCSIEDCIKHTYTLSNPTPKAPEREKFWEDYRTKDFKYIIEKYAQN